MSMNYKPTDWSDLDEIGRRLREESGYDNVKIVSTSEEEFAKEVQKPKVLYRTNRKRQSNCVCNLDDKISKISEDIVDENIQQVEVKDDEEYKELCKKRKKFASRNGSLWTAKIYCCKYLRH